MLFGGLGIAHIQLQASNGLEGLQVVRLDGQGLVKLGDSIPSGFAIEAAAAVIRVTLVDLA